MNDYMFFVRRPLNGKGNEMAKQYMNLSLFHCSNPSNFRAIGFLYTVRALRCRFQSHHGSMLDLHKVLPDYTGISTVNSSEDGTDLWLPRASAAKPNET
jgi:hypothetical protein